MMARARRDPAEEGQGNNKLVWWVMGIVGSLLSAGLIRDLSKSIEVEHRLSVIETQNARDREYYREKLEDIKGTLDAISRSLNK